MPKSADRIFVGNGLSTASTPPPWWPEQRQQSGAA
jgi:hypothetical protein